MMRVSHKAGAVRFPFTNIRRNPCINRCYLVYYAVHNEDADTMPIWDAGSHNSGGLHEKEDSCFKPGRLYRPGLVIRALFTAQDFGDAPDPSYPTLLASNGPRHLLSPLFSDTTGTANPMPRWHDVVWRRHEQLLVDDEDGIRFLSFLLPGQNCAVEVIASAPGLLNGWIDFDFNMQWTDAYDQVFRTASQPGSNILSFSVREMSCREC